MKTIDISSEEYRTYTYPEGATYTIHHPVKLHVINDGEGATHRVIDGNGVTHRPERAWVAISWKPRSGAPAFVA